MTTVQILYWHDIPVQVKAKARRDRHSLELSARFQEAVDSAAMAAGLIGTDDYLEGFRWTEPQPRDGTPQAAAEAVAAELEARFQTVDWRATAEALRQAKASG